ncbi:hypothetical protein GCM10010377_79320 [Streptomyces viridiviolaceus]|nr:hypothetical protein GCM10010377_79320 [Streptomyces viridiviolaceus]
MITRWLGRKFAKLKQRWGNPKWRALAVVAFVAVIALVALLVIALAVPGPRPNTMPYEVARVCLQVLGVSIVGFFVGLETFNLQQERLERQRLDDRIRAFLTEMLDAYHGVKQVRRVLRAETAPSTAPTITADAYSRLLPELSKHQLVFESLARSAPLIEGHVNGGSAISVKEAGGKFALAHGQQHVRGTVTKSLTAHCKDIEGYLNDVVAEFEVFHQFLPQAGRISLAKLHLEETDRFLHDTDEFRAKVSRRIREMVKVLETTLLRTSGGGRESSGGIWAKLKRLVKLDVLTEADTGSFTRKQ